MQKWEYLEVLRVFSTADRIIPSKGKAFFSEKGDNIPKLSEYLDALGTEGWEMINAQERDLMSNNYTTCYFKCPIE
jgi:hypothetical protein